VTGRSVRTARTARRRVLSAASLSIGLVLAVAGAVAAASPNPSEAVGGDPRSVGQGPGLMGDPAFAVLAVIAIGLIATVGTLAWVKLTGGRRS
jgi:hypothetical protein